MGTLIFIYCEPLEPLTGGHSLLETLLPWPMWHNYLLDFPCSSIDSFSFNLLQVFFFLNLVYIHWYFLEFCHLGFDTFTFCSTFSNLTVIFILIYHFSLSKPKSMSNPDVQLLTKYLCMEISNIPQIWWVNSSFPPYLFLPFPIYNVSLNWTLIHSFIPSHPSSYIVSHQATSTS